MPLMKLLALKLFLTLLVTVTLCLPWIKPELGSGMLREVQLLGVSGSGVVAIVLSVMYWRYVRECWLGLGQAL